MSPQYRLPKDYGVVSHPTKMIIVVYHLVDEWAAKPAPYQTGGEITHYVRTGRKTYEAHRLGETVLLELTPELCAEIERDISKRGISL